MKHVNILSQFCFSNATLFSCGLVFLYEINTEGKEPVMVRELNCVTDYELLSATWKLDVRHSNLQPPSPPNMN